MKTGNARSKTRRSVGLQAYRSGRSPLRGPCRPGGLHYDSLAQVYILFVARSAMRTGLRPALLEQIGLFATDLLPHGLELEPAVDPARHLLARRDRRFVRDVNGLARRLRH